MCPTKIKNQCGKCIWDSVRNKAERTWIISYPIRHSQLSSIRIWPLTRSEFPSVPIPKLEARYQARRLRAHLPRISYLNLSLEGKPDDVGQIYWTAASTRKPFLSGVFISHQLSATQGADVTFTWLREGGDLFVRLSIQSLQHIKGIVATSFSMSVYSV